MKTFRWLIFCALTGLTGGKALFGMMGTISTLRWHPELTSLMGLTPLQFGAMGFVVTVFWGALATVSWMLRKAKGTSQSQIKTFLTPILLSAWVGAVLFVIGYEKRAEDEAAKIPSSTTAG